MRCGRCVSACAVAAAIIDVAARAVAARRIGRVVPDTACATRSRCGVGIVGVTEHGHAAVCSVGRRAAARPPVANGDVVICAGDDSIISQLGKPAARATRARPRGVSAAATTTAAPDPNGDPPHGRWNGPGEVACSRVGVVTDDIRHSSPFGTGRTHRRWVCVQLQAGNRNWEDPRTCRSRYGYGQAARAEHTHPPRCPILHRNRHDHHHQYPFGRGSWHRCIGWCRNLWLQYPKVTDENRHCLRLQRELPRCVGHPRARQKKYRSSCFCS